MSDTSSEASPPPSQPHHRSYLVVGIVAAAVSAATAAYIFWSRSRHLVPHVETVQELLERCHNQVKSIEQQIGDLQQQHSSASTTVQQSA